MTGNEVTPIYYDEAVCLRDSGFVQQTHAVGRGRAAPLMRALCCNTSVTDSKGSLIYV
jgi:hypothetical protein